MDKNYVAPAKALQKLRTARSISQTVYLYGATGYGKTERVRQYLSNRRYTYLSCEEQPWGDGALPSEEPGRQNRRVVVIDDLHRLKSEELRQEITALEQREDIWLILISRSPIPLWLMPRHIKDVFVVICEKDLRMGRDEITAYLDVCDIAYTEEDIKYLVLLDEKAANLLSLVERRPLFDQLITQKDLVGYREKYLKQQYLTPEELAAEHEERIAAQLERERQAEAAREAEIRAKFQKVERTFTKVYDFLDWIHYPARDVQVACFIVREQLGALLSSTGCCLDKKNMGSFLKVCGKLVENGALEIGEMQEYIKMIKEDVTNDNNCDEAC